MTTAGVRLAERFTLMGIGPYYPIQIAEPLELPDRSPAKGPVTFEVFAAYLTHIAAYLMRGQYKRINAK